MNAAAEPTLNGIFDTLSEKQKCALYELIGSIMENRVIYTDLYRKCAGSLETIDQIRLVEYLTDYALKDSKRRCVKEK